MSKGLAEQHYDAIVGDSYCDCAKYAAQHTTLIYAVPYTFVKQIVLGLPSMVYITQAHIYETKICLIVYYGDGYKIECFYCKLEFLPFNDAGELIKLADTAYWRWGSMIVHTGIGTNTTIVIPNSQYAIDELKRYSSRHYESLVESYGGIRIIFSLQTMDWDKLCPEGYTTNTINILTKQVEKANLHEGVIVYQKNGIVVREINNFRDLLFESHPSQIQAWMPLNEASAANEYYLDIVNSVRDGMNQILILGGGVGHLCNQIHLKFPKLKITNVELNSEVVDVGRKYFNLVEDEYCKFIIDDAVHYVDNCTVK